MAEPLFGTVTPMWSAVPAFGYGPAPVPTPMAPVNRPMVSAPSGLAGVPGATPDPFAFGRNAFSTLGGPGVDPTMSLFPSPPLTASFPVVGVTAPALLNAVAVKRGQPLGPTTDQEIEEFIYDALELIAGTNDVDVRCDGGRVTLSGSVPQKRLKRDVGEIAWTIPGINDVHNNITIAARRRSRGSNRERENEPAAVGARKQA